MFLIRILLGFGQKDPDPEGQKLLTKIGKGENFLFWSARCSLLRTEGFTCSLDLLYGGRPRDKYVKCQFLMKKIYLYCRKFFWLLVIKTLDLDPDSYWPEMLDPDPDPHWKYWNTFFFRNTVLTILYLWILRTKLVVYTSDRCSGCFFFLYRYNISMCFESVSAICIRPFGLTMDGFQSFRILQIRAPILKSEQLRVHFF